MKYQKKPVVVDTSRQIWHHLGMESEIYTCSWGREFKFNDHVCFEMVIGVTDAKRAGRLVQVRKGIGDFGSDKYLIRLRDGGLAAFENVMMRHVNDKSFEDNFHRSNGVQPPVIIDQPPHEDDSINVEYTLANKYPETGFIIHKPKQPKSGTNSFAMTITSTK